MMSDFSIDYILNRAGDHYYGTNASMGILQRLAFNEQLQQRQRSLVLPNFPDNLNVQHLQQPYINVMPSGSSMDESFELKVRELPMFDWLQYTRYHPPKVPRNLRGGVSKRTPGRLPRIPFSPAQLQALEEAYKKSNYLSAEDANLLGEKLELTNTRVKIWFQNRRARERRERREKEESGESTLSISSSPEPEEIVVIV